MFATIFNLLINLLATIIQIVCAPINAIVTTALPDVGNAISQATSGLSNIVSSMSWGLGLLPPIVIEMLSFIILCEIAKHTIFTSTHVLSKVWVVLQKVKFW